MPLKSDISPNSFIHVPKLSSSSTSEITVLFLITGNPGLIKYYHPFLSLLAATPTCASSAVGPIGAHVEDDGRAAFDPSQCVIAGFSLMGFEIDGSIVGGGEGGDGDRRGGSAVDVGLVPDGAGTIRSLARQVQITLRRLRRVVEMVVVEEEEEVDDDDEGLEDGGGRGRSKNGKRMEVKVVLMGHSVGAYIALEVIRLWRERWQELRENWDGDVRVDGGLRARPFEIMGAILLTPTIVDIAKSRSGRIAQPLLEYTPGLPAVAQGLVRLLTWMLPESVLIGIVQKVTGMQGAALETTVAFLRSKTGVRQSLSMARDEMREIDEDRWGEEVWGIAKPATTVSASTTNACGIESSRPPKLVFYFAHTDHWVANATREEIMKVRGSIQGKDRPLMIVEEEGRLEHGWPIRQSELVAQKVRGWLGDILGPMR